MAGWYLCPLSVIKLPAGAESQNSFFLRFRDGSLHPVLDQVRMRSHRLHKPGTAPPFKAALQRFPQSSCPSGNLSASVGRHALCSSGYGILHLEAGFAVPEVYLVQRLIQFGSIYLSIKRIAFCHIRHPASGEASGRRCRSPSGCHQ